MTDAPTLFTEVLRRAEESREILRASITLREQNTMNYAARLTEERAAHKSAIGKLEAEFDKEHAALTELREALARVEHILEPLADLARCNTEKARPGTRPEQRRTRRTLPELVFSAVAEHPGQGQDFLAEVLTKSRRRQTDAALVRTILHGHPDKVEWRDGWYLTGRSGGDQQVASENSGGSDALDNSGDQLEMSALVDPDVPPVWDERKAERPEIAAALSQARTEPSPDDQAKIPPEPETVLTARQERVPTPPPEKTLDFIRRAGAEGLNDHQLRKHLDNLPGLVERGVIECGQDGRTRYVGESAETAK